MKSDEIKLGDWMRVFVGETPPAFFLEIIIRLVFLFILLVVAMRLLGLRMSAQLNRIEMIALFSLAAAIGVPLQAPDRGLLPAVAIAVIVIAIGRLVATLSFRNQKFEDLAEDDYTILVQDGVVQLKKLKKTRLTIDRLFAQLRTESIRHLGEVKRLYFEANGSFSVVKEQSAKPGLPILLPEDREFLEEQPKTDALVCHTCGAPKEWAADQQHCVNCGNDQWMAAII